MLYRFQVELSDVDRGVYESLICRRPDFHRRQIIRAAANFLANITKFLTLNSLKKKHQAVFLFFCQLLSTGTLFGDFRFGLTTRILIPDDDLDILFSLGDSCFKERFN